MYYGKIERGYVLMSTVNYNSKKICLSLIIIFLLIFNSIKSSNAQETSDFEIISVYPKDRVSDYYLERITVGFSNDLDFSSINNETFKIEPEIRGNLSYDERNYRLIFTADDAFEIETEYNITISQEVRDINNQSLEEDYQWSFIYHVPNIHHPVMIELYCEDNSSYIEPGRETTFNITVMNTLCGSGEFYLNHSTLPKGWKCSFSENNFFLSSGLERIVNVTIRAPMDAKYDENIKITIYGTTEEDFDEINLYCTVRGKPENIELVMGGFILILIVIIFMFVYIAYKKQKSI
jgi:hypothetical protein